MRTVILALLVITMPMSKGCNQPVWQSGPQTVDRGSSVKLNCSLSLMLYLKKPFLTWIKIDKNEVETQIYPSNGSSDTTRFHVDSEAFHKSMDAGILLSDLRGRDSGRYLCSVIILRRGMPQECRGQGTYVTVRATMYDKLIACCPLGVFIAALLVLHGMVYKQWMGNRKFTRRSETP